jgi:hypothetical protein
MSALKKLSFPTFGMGVGQPGKTGWEALGPDSPFPKAASDPTTIFVVVAPNSMEDADDPIHLLHPNNPKDK